MRVQPAGSFWQPNSFSSWSAVRNPFETLPRGLDIADFAIKRARSDSTESIVGPAVAVPHSHSRTSSLLPWQAHSVKSKASPACPVLLVKTLTGPNDPRLVLSSCLLALYVMSTSTFPPGVRAPLTADNENDHSGLVVVLTSFYIVLTLASVLARVFSLHRKRIVQADDYVFAGLVVGLPSRPPSCRADEYTIGFRGLISDRL